MDNCSEPTPTEDHGVVSDGKEIGAQFEPLDPQSNGAKKDLNSQQDSTPGKLFVGGLAWTTTEESFTKYFKLYGEVTDSVIICDKFTGRARGFGFVSYADPTIADTVLTKEHMIDGKKVELKRTIPKQNVEPEATSRRTKQIFVGGLASSVTNDDLRGYFSAFGGVVDTKIMTNHENGKSKGYGFVTFENEDDVENILLDKAEHKIGGKKVNVNRAERRNVNAKLAHGDAKVGHNGYYVGGQFSVMNNFYNVLGNFCESCHGIYSGYNACPCGFRYGTLVYGSSGFGWGVSVFGCAY